MRFRFLLAGVTVSALAAAPLSASTSDAADPGFVIAFVSNRDGNDEIYTMGAFGQDQTRLTNNTTHDTTPNWSPDGGTLAFVRRTAPNVFDDEIWVMDPDGAGQTNITNTAERDINPRWSPDGTKIAFSSDRDGDFDIYVMNPDGTGVLQMTDDASADVDFDPSWSPDGSKIAFRRGVATIYTVNADGTDEAPLPGQPSGGTPGSNNFAPEWSPDGAQIAYYTDTHDQGCLPQLCNYEIYVATADGATHTRLTNHFLGDRTPLWSPNGSKILFIRGWEGNDNLYSMNPDGSGESLIGNVDLGFRWFPQGLKVVYGSAEDGDLEIFSAHQDGTLVTPLTDNTASDSLPSPRGGPAVGGLAAAPDVTRGSGGSSTIALAALGAATALAFAGGVVALRRRRG